MTQKLLCLGYGYTARAFARRAKSAGYSVSATLRRAAAASGLAGDGVEPVFWTDSGLGPNAFDGVSAVLVSTPPDERGCPSFAAAAEEIARRARSISWLGYLSSNGVYGDYGGARVDEHSGLRASSTRAKMRIRAEAAWASHAAAYALPLVIFRLPGIYGPGRSALDAIRARTARRIVKPGQVFNRAHVDDIAAALAASLARPAAGELFNISDDEPAPPQDVITFACKLLCVAPPPETPVGEAALSEMAASFYVDNKRVSNALMKEKLLPALAYANYREGVAAILAEERRRTS